MKHGGGSLYDNCVESPSLRVQDCTGMLLEGGNQPEILIKYSISPARIVREKILE